MFPKLDTSFTDVRKMATQHSCLVVPSYLADFLANLSHPKKIDAIKLARLIFPGLGLAPAKHFIELISGVISPGEISSGRTSIHREYAAETDCFLITIVEYDRVISHGDSVTEYLPFIREDGSIVD